MPSSLLAGAGARPLVIPQLVRVGGLHLIALARMPPAPPPRTQVRRAPLQPLPVGVFVGQHPLSHQREQALLRSVVALRRVIGKRTTRHWAAPLIPMRTPAHHPQTLVG